jgi:DNA-binding response OmpR family regulator
MTTGKCQAKTELRILGCLAKNINGITRLEELWTFAWESNKPVNRKSIQVMMSRVRSKIAASGLRIDSLVDIGYILSHGRCCNKE